MSDLEKPYKYVLAQDPEPQSTTNGQNTTNGRIVQARPPFYSFKRDAHPFTWAEWAAEPMFRSADNGYAHRFMANRSEPEKPAGIRFDVGGVGAGSGFGPEVILFNKNFLGRGIDVEIPLVYTYKRYESYRFTSAVPIKQGFAKGLTFDIGTAYRSRAHDDMFSIGNDSVLGTESQVRIVSRDVAVGFSARFTDRFTAAIHETYRNVGVTRPLSGISAQDKLGDLAIPGLLTGGTILSTVFAFDHRKTEETQVIARTNREHFEVSFNQSAGNGTFAYWKYRLEALHFFPLSSDHRTAIALRAFAETNQRTRGDVPFFDMPVIGTWETLRGYENFRFRDRSALAFSVE
jgi:outer membrane protein assembly factor BamA